MSLPEPKEVAYKFLDVFRESFTPLQLQQIDKRNAESDDPRICHSHDFVDANEIMDQAFNELGIEMDLNDDSHTALWNQAWTIAKRIGFYGPQVGDMIYSKDSDSQGRITVVNGNRVEWNSKGLRGGEELTQEQLDNLANVSHDGNLEEDFSSFGRWKPDGEFWVFDSCLPEGS